MSPGFDALQCASDQIAIVPNLSKLSDVQRARLAGHLVVSRTGENPQRPGLVKTPERFAKALDHLLSGYEMSVEGVVGAGVFPAESRGLVVVNDIEFYSLCEHHLLPFWGKISVGYFPGEKIIGLSKIPRLVEMFARRVQVQERLTQQVGDALMKTLGARSVLVRAQAQHFCMMMRGVEKQSSSTVTESIVGEESLTEREKISLFDLVQFSE